jgi:hypothetical protein
MSRGRILLSIVGCPYVRQLYSIRTGVRIPFNLPYVHRRPRMPAVFQVLFLKVQNDATMHGVLLERNGVYLACSQPSHAL